MLSIGLDVGSSLDIRLIETDILSGISGVVGRVERLIDEVVVLSSDLGVSDFSRKRSGPSISSGWLACRGCVFLTSRSGEGASKRTVLFGALSFHDWKLSSVLRLFSGLSGILRNFL